MITKSLIYVINPSFSPSRGIRIDFSIDEEDAISASLAEERLQPPSKADIPAGEKPLRIKLTEEQTQKLLSLIADLRLPVNTPWIVGCDGAISRLELLSGFQKVSFEWWGEIPEAWADLGPLIAALNPLLEHFPARRPRFPVSRTRDRPQA